MLNVLLVLAAGCVTQGPELSGSDPMELEAFDVMLDVTIAGGDAGAMFVDQDDTQAEVQGVWDAPLLTLEGGEYLGWSLELALLLEGESLTGLVFGHAPERPMEGACELSAVL